MTISKKIYDELITISRRIEHDRHSAEITDNYKISRDLIIVSPVALYVGNKTMYEIRSDRANMLDLRCEGGQYFVYLHPYKVEIFIVSIAEHFHLSVLPL